MLNYPELVNQDYSYEKLYPQSHPDLAALQYFVFAIVFGGTLLVVRDCGYRLNWRQRRGSPPVAEST